MTISNLFSLLGGLAFFLYGMWMMRQYLQSAAGEKLEGLVKGITKTPLLGFLAGTAITAALQSSSAVMVLLVGFVDAGILTLLQAVYVILGANIGTTITGQLIALDMTGLAPLCSFVGIFLLLCSKKEKWQYPGGVLAGLGVLFTGLDTMGKGLAPLGESPLFLSLLTQCRHPITGIIGGSVFTALLQSSSASVGILQTLAREGLVAGEQSIYLVLGQNIGTCVTGFIAAAAAKQAAKKAAALHLWVNILGAAFFVLVCEIFPAAQWIAALTPGQPARQIANIHTIFNVSTSLLLLPFGRALVRAVDKKGNIVENSKI